MTSRERLCLLSLSFLAHALLHPNSWPLLNLVGVPVSYQATRPVASHDVYMEDFISMAQGNFKRRLHVKRSLFEALDSVFRSLLSTDHPDHQ
jgi:hypothetical protein